MIGHHTADEIRAAEQATGELLTSGVLMRRAATGLAHVILSELRLRRGAIYGARVVLIVGAGDNGGDALHAGALVRARGVAVDAVLTAPDRAHPGGLAALRRAGGRVVSVASGAYDLAVDGVVGIGGSGPLRPTAAAAFEHVTAPIIAVDIPSGVDADTGQVHDPSVVAEVTVTFGTRRRAHALAAHRCGRIECIDIGIDPPAAHLVALGDAEIGDLWPVPGPADDKYTQGVTGVIAGSDRFPGAAVLCTGAAVAATSGMVRYAGSAASQVVSRHPEIVASMVREAGDLDDVGRVQAWVIGPGAGTDSRAADLVAAVLDTDVPVLLDADAITVVSEHRSWVADRVAPTLLTPHAGEFARLAGRPVGADRVAAVTDLAVELGATVLLKGRATLVADGAGPVLVNDAGSSWAATAGAGDVLSGIAGALLAAGLAPRPAAAAAARAHARAASLAAQGDGDGRGAPIGASDLLAAVRPAIRVLRSVGDGQR
ncbi:NAD(P)H-hydrate dehydratase [Williamsia herbipolensis]|uniref:Bifunctional NAD(P)H-hydrate repair enzyme n=1 Tax=Williamsia herbipolensis TaxID=1603258 RepID=A0AAU4K2B0_9NOCA|nr:NAD(P)H-hydrate dehydratase [Williamsia herbipolensis]